MDLFDDFIGVEMGGEGELYEDPIDICSFIQFSDFL
jgi:hypothetical protein